MRQAPVDDLESQLRELFDRQAAGISTSNRVWDDAPMVVAAEHGPRRHARPRSALVAAVTVAAAVLLVVGIIGAAPTHDAVRVGGQPGTATRVHFATPQVRFDASAMEIEANGQIFTAGGAEVGVHSDPGYASYQTLELEWQEHGVPMRLYLYFSADAHDWWVSSLTTYNGRSQPDSIEYRGPFFRTSLRTAFAGDVDLAPSGAPLGAHLHITNLRLQPFLPPAACATQTGAYAIVSNEGNDISLDAAGSSGSAVFDDTVTLYDRATCRPVSTPGRFTYDFMSSEPGVVSAVGQGCDPQGLPAGYCDTHVYLSLTAKALGRATVHITAVDVRGIHVVVAVLDLQVTAKR
jgi:hypothetical protein